MSTKRKPPTIVAQPVLTPAAKLPVKSRIDESMASVSASASLPSIQTIEISSDSESEYDDVSDNEELSGDEVDKDEGQQQLSTSNSIDRASPDRISRLKPKEDAQDADADMLSPPLTRDQDQDPDASDLDPTSPTFGDLIRGNEEAIDVTTALAAQQEPTPNSLIQSHPRSLAPPSLSSLGTVLNQALRTDDTDLLESCLNTTDMTTVRNTIQRMDSALAGRLLTKLAARMHRRPGRAHTLMTWVQAALIAHGGALAAQPDVVKRLTELNRVLEERARGLNSLLILKGKLDMLEAQMQIRRGNRGRHVNAGRRRGDSEDEATDDEEGIIYVEGEEEDNLVNGITGARRDGEEEDEFPITNGMADSDDDSEDEEDDRDMDEPEVTDEESLDEDEVDHDDVEESGEEDDSDVEPAAPPAKLQKTTKAFRR